MKCIFSREISKYSNPFRKLKENFEVLKCASVSFGHLFMHFPHCHDTVLELPVFSSCSYNPELSCVTLCEAVECEGEEC